MRATYDIVARRQLGLVTIKQLADLGWTYEQVRAAVRRRELFMMRRGVYRVAGAPTTQEVVWLAAQLAAGDDHVISHLTATKAWKCKDFPDPTHIDLLTAAGSPARYDGVRTHETLWLPDNHITRYKSLPITTTARTLMDTCGEVPFAVLKRAANDLVRRDLMRPVDFVRTFEETPVSGRRKSVPAKLLVAHFVPGYDAGESDAELDVVDILVNAGYPRPAQQIWVRSERWKYRIDVGYPDIKHGFEFQGEKDHLTREAFHEDALRIVRLQAAGWTMWPVTSRHARAEILLAAASAFRQFGVSGTAS